KRRIRAAPPGERYFSVASEEPATRDVRTTHKSRGRKNASSIEENHRRDPASQKGRSRRTPAGITGSARGNAPTGFHGQSTGSSQAGGSSDPRNRQQEGDATSGVQNRRVHRLPVPRRRPNLCHRGAGGRGRQA